MKKIVICAALSCLLLHGMQEQKEESIEDMQKRYDIVIKAWHEEKKFENKQRRRDEMLELDNAIVSRILHQDDQKKDEYSKFEQDVNFGGREGITAEGIPRSPSRMILNPNVDPQKREPQGQNPKLTHDIKNNFKDSIEIIGKNKIKKENAINLDEYLSRVHTPITINPKEKKDQLVKIFIDKPLKNYLESIWCAYEEQYPMIFEALTLALQKHKGLTKDFLLKILQELDDISQQCVIAMAKLLIPQKYKTLGDDSVTLLQNSKLQDLLYIVLLEKNNFQMGNFKELISIYHQLDEKIKQYIQLRSNSTHLFIKCVDGMHILLSKELAKKSFTLHSLIEINEDFAIFPVPYRYELIEIFWSIVQNPITSALEKIDKNNIKEIMNIDNYFNIDPVPIKVDQNEKEKIINFYKLFYTYLIKTQYDENKKEYVLGDITRPLKSFLYYTFVTFQQIRLEREEVFEKDPNIQFTSVLFDNEGYLRIHAEKKIEEKIHKGIYWITKEKDNWERHYDYNQKTYFLDDIIPVIDLNTQQTVVDSPAQRRKNLIFRCSYARFFKHNFSVKDDLIERWPKNYSCIEFGPNCDFIVTCNLPGTTLICYKFNKEELNNLEKSKDDNLYTLLFKKNYSAKITSLITHPNAPMFAVSTDAGNIDIYRAEDDKFFLIGTKDIKSDIAVFKSTKFSIKYMNWSNDGSCFAVAGNDCWYAIYEDYLKIPENVYDNDQSENSKILPVKLDEQEFPKNQLQSVWDKLKKWIIPGIAVVGAAGGWWLYNKYFQKQPSVKVEND